MTKKNKPTIPKKKKEGWMEEKDGGTNETIPETTELVPIADNSKLSTNEENMLHAITTASKEKRKEPEAPDPLARRKTLMKTVIAEKAFKWREKSNKKTDTLSEETEEQEKRGSDIHYNVLVSLFYCIRVLAVVMTLLVGIVAINYAIGQVYILSSHDIFCPRLTKEQVHQRYQSLNLSQGFYFFYIKKK
ncbi:hypothetical protein RFI_23152 [Reticulomyxa filosa]|uniref:Uncharacterized protein n=1 Tax=Reticulomyxa filosa TaxID=46433 RepID=X6MK20_RETFI|nr:hypothetical protein RFI_23152 [Reticulomyxa filosa]|eukprot:ETO14214.1 hypothetical protein RFI_23152 [Reticulomyxa filosa]